MAPQLCILDSQLEGGEMSLKPWGDRRAVANANHFNPAYCGVLIYEFIRSYKKAKGSDAPFALIFCALPIALHPRTRDRLPRSTVTKLFPWLQQNRDVRIGFADRARNLTPYVREALRYALARRAIGFTENGLVVVGPKRASFTPTAADEATPEIRDTVDAIRKIARWFAAAGDTSTILAAWGIRI